MPPSESVLTDFDCNVLEAQVVNPLFIYFFSRRCVRASRNAFSGIFPWCKFKCYISLVFFFLAFCHVSKKRTRTICKKMYIPRGSLAFRFVLKDNYLREFYPYNSTNNICS